MRKLSPFSREEMKLPKNRSPREHILVAQSGSLRRPFLVVKTKIGKIVCLPKKNSPNFFLIGGLILSSSVFSLFFIIRTP